VLAIDIGGTKILAALIKDSQILRETEFRTDPGLGPDGWIDAIADQVTGWRGDYGQVAVAATGLINQGRWSALNPATLAIPDAYPLVDRLTDKFDIAALAINSPAYRSALELYNTLYQAGASPKASLSYEYAETNAAFASGQTATALQWNAAASELTDPAKSPAIAEEVGIAAPPSGPAGRADHIHGLGLGLNKNAKNKPGAVKFLAWLASEDAALLYAKNGGSPALAPDVVAKIAKDRPDLAKLGECAGAYGCVMNGGTSANAFAVYELQAKEFTGYWSGQQTLDQALSNTKAAMERLLKQ